MKVLLFSRSFPPAIGGIERFAESLADWLADQGHDVCVVTRADIEGDEPDRSYRVVRRPSAGHLFSLARRADVIHANGLSLRGVGLGVASRRPTVVTHAGYQAVCPTGLCVPRHGHCAAGPSLGPCASCPERGARGIADVQFHAAACRTVSANVTVSDYLGSTLGLPHSRTIYNPVSREAFAAATETPGVGGLVAFAGRLVAEKGLDLLLRALTLVPEARLEVVGDGPMFPTYRDLASDLGLSLRVSFLGSRPFGDVSAAYARASVVCVPSSWHEPFGLSAAEAMAMRRPLVVTPSGALAELCADGRGFVTADCEPRSIAASLESALSDEHERARRAGSAHAFALDQLTQDRAGIAYQNVYEDVVG